MDRLRAVGAGIPISIKDLFDVAGEVTGAGSRGLVDAPPAKVEAPAVARLRRAGFVLIGRTNMTEFAYSGLGLNPLRDAPQSLGSGVRTRPPRHPPGRVASGSLSD